MLVSAAPIRQDTHASRGAAGTSPETTEDRPGTIRRWVRRARCQHWLICEKSMYSSPRVCNCGTRLSVLSLETTLTSQAQDLRRPAGLSLKDLGQHRDLSESMDLPEAYNPT